MSIDPEKELFEVFQVFDKNKDGFISSEELYEVLSKLGESITRVSLYLRGQFRHYKVTNNQLINLFQFNQIDIKVREYRRGNLKWTI